MAEPLCDLVLLSWNHLELTKSCLESLFSCTDVTSRLVIVDNGSEKNIRQYLGTIRPFGAIQEVIIIQNETNEGFPRGMNHGMRKSSAQYVCLLNNDLIFTKQWLSRMLEVAQARAEIGILNPASNTFGELPPKGQSIDDYAALLESKRDVYTEVGMCIGFCMLIKRAVIERIGFLSEEIKRFSYEDEDYCMRAQLAGFQCVVAGGSYVYHAERKTVGKIADHQNVFKESKLWCENRWGRSLRIAYPRFRPAQFGSSELRDWLNQMVSSARKRRYVYAYYPRTDGVTKDDLFRSVGLIPHADVIWREVSARCPRLGAAVSILQRQKKRFDLILSPDQKWEKLMRRLRWIHKADVILADDLKRIEEICQIKSRSTV